MLRKLVLTGVLVLAGCQVAPPPKPLGQLPTWPPRHASVGMEPCIQKPLPTGTSTATIGTAAECSAPCGPPGTGTPVDPEWVNATVDLVYGYVRAGVLQGIIPNGWGAPLPSTVWEHTYPRIDYCLTEFNIDGISGTFTGKTCAWSATTSEPATILVALETRGTAKGRIGWEMCNFVIYWRLRNWTLADGPEVGACAGFVTRNNP